MKTAIAGGEHENVWRGATPAGLDSSSDRDIEEQLEEEEGERTPLSEVGDDDEERLDRLAAMRKLNGPRGGASGLADAEMGAEQALKAQILILCTALGGLDVATGDGEYVLGADALACLKDLKRWIRAVDDATDHWSVASACDDNGLVVNDLIPILVQYPGKFNDSNRSFYTGILLSSLELLVALTRPLMLDTERASPAKVDLYIKLKKAHVRYKSRILNHAQGRCLKSVVGLALPILQTAREQRSARDTIILNLCLNLVRNVIRIEPAETTVTMRTASSKTQQVNDNMPVGVSFDDISFDTLLTAFRRNKVLRFLQTITAGLGREFDERVLGGVCLDCYFYLLYGMDAGVVAGEEVTAATSATSATASATSPEKLSNSASSSLGAALLHEKALKKNLLRQSTSRHANFGTLLSVRQADSATSLTVSGQSRLVGADLLEELDASKSKKSVAPRWAANRGESTRSDFDTRLETPRRGAVSKTTLANLRRFCTDFVEAGFGVLVASVRKQLTGAGVSGSAFMEFHYLYLIGWVLRFERSGRAKRVLSESNGAPTGTPAGTRLAEELIRSNDNETRSTEDDARVARVVSADRFGYLQESLSSDTLQLLKNNLPRYLQNREHSLLRVAADCFKEVLLAVVAMHKLEENGSDEEIRTYRATAERLLRTLFASEEEIDVLFRVPQNAQRVSPAFARDIAEFTCVLLRVLEYVRGLKVPVAMRKKVRKSRKKESSGAPSGSEEYSGSEGEEFDSVSAERYSALNNTRFETYERRLLHESIVSLFVAQFSRFGELEEHEMRNCISYFNRLLLKKDEHFLKLARLDFMLALHDIKDAHVRFSSATMRDLSKLLAYFMHTLEKLHRKTGRLFFELLTANQEHDRSLRTYLLTGEAGRVSESRPRDSRDVSFRSPGLSYSHKVSLAASGLVFSDNGEVIHLIKGALSQSESDQIVLKDAILSRNALARLLLQTIGFVERSSRWTLTNATAEHISTTVAALGSAVESPLEDWEDELVREAESEKDNVSDVGESGPEDNDLADNSPTELDLLEARLESGVGRVKGRALKRGGRALKRRLDPEADDVDFKRAKGNKKGKKSSKRSRGTRKQVNKDVSKEVSEPAKHLSSKFIASSDDESDDDAVQKFYEDEKRLHELMLENSGKQITPEQFWGIYGRGEVDGGRSDKFISVESEGEAIGENVSDDEDNSDDNVGIGSDISDDNNEGSDSDNNNDNNGGTNIGNSTDNDSDNSDDNGDDNNDDSQLEPNEPKIVKSRIARIVDSDDE